jgi:hypothetical protein
VSVLAYRIPRGWRRDPTTEAGDLLRPVRDRSWFRANVIVGVDALPEAIDEERRWAAALAHLERRRHGLTVLVDTAVVVPAGPGSLRIVSFDVPGGCVAQLQLQVSLEAGCAHDAAATDDDAGDAARAVIGDLVATMALDELGAHTDALAALIRSLRGE